MKALIQGNRIAEVRAEEFPVASPLFWVDCAEDVTPETHYYDNGIQASPVPPAPTDRELLERQMDIYEQSPGNFMTERARREWFLNDAVVRGYIPESILDPATTLDADSAEFLAFPLMLRRAVLVERQMRIWRAEREAL